MSWLTLLRSMLAVGLFLGLSVGTVSLVTGGCPNMDNPPVDDGGTDDGGTDDGGTDDGGTDDGGDDGGTDDGGDDGGTDDGGDDEPSDPGNIDPNDGSTDGGADDGGDDGDDPNDPPAPPRPASVDLALIATVGDPVPDQPGAVFTQFGTPIIDKAGRVAFWAKFTGGNGSDGLYVWDGTELVRVVDDNPSRTGVVPGRAANEYFGGLSANSPFTNEPDDELPMAWGNDGKLVFVSWINGGTAAHGLFRWRASDGDIILITDNAQQASLYDDAQASGFTAQIFQPGLSDNGIAIFASQYTYVSTNESLPPLQRFIIDQRGIYTSNGTSVTRILDTHPTGDIQVPDVPEPSEIADVQTLTTLNPAGSMLMQSTYYSTAGEQHGTVGVQLLVSSTLVRAIDNRTTATFPGLPAGSIVNDSFDPYDAISIGTDLRIAVDTTLTVGTTTRDTVLLWDGAEWHEISTGAQFASALLSGVNAGGQIIARISGDPYMANGFNAVNLVGSPPVEVGTDAVWSTAAGAINNNGRALLRYTRSGQDGLAFWTGGELLFVATADAILMPPAPEQDRPGRSGALNDSDAFAFVAQDAGADGTVGTADDIYDVYLGQGDPGE